ncbi:Gfo/Idh/MocA family protein [Rhizobium leguminosarum]|uniref:Gfo/Idh/MocA family protein n=1 Tax=Rhizobium leguminosarum TaxID=384 RepID=UPI0013EEC902|nr:Gfo/Idh/MocA family oxidoreductase [Rhizobium leguminosarum]
MVKAKRCLIVGLGQIGAGYDIDSRPDGGIYTHARAIALHPSFELVGGVDPVESQRQRFQVRYGVEAFESIGLAMRRLRPEIAVIATPAELHLRHVEQVLAVNTPEIIICEKPLALSEAEGAELVRRCEEAGVTLFVNFIRRSEPGAIEVRRRIEAGEIAAPLKGSFWYSKGLFNNGSHFINLLQYWLGAIKEHAVLDEGRHWAGSDPEPDVRIVFDHGSVVVQAAWEEAFSFYGGELLSQSGRLAYRNGGSLIEWQGLSRDENFTGYSVLSAEVENIHNDMDRYQWHVYEQLSHFLADEPSELCSGREALATLRFVAAIAGRYRNEI